MKFLRTIFDLMFAPPGALDDTPHRAYAAAEAVNTSSDSSSADYGTRHDDPVYNPTTGLPMMGGMGGIDIGGHTWCEPPPAFSSCGTDFHTSHWDSAPSHDFGSCGTSGGMDFGSSSHHWEP